MSDPRGEHEYGARLAQMAMPVVLPDPRRT